MKCEKQSEKCQAHRYTTSADAIMPMTDHLLTFIPRPVWMAPCHRDSFAFCFRALYDDGDSWRPRLQNAEVLICLKDSLTFARCSFSPRSPRTLVVNISVSATFSLFLYRFFFSLLLFSLLFIFFCSRSPFLPLCHLYFHQTFSRGRGFSGTKPVFFLWLMPSFKMFRDLLEVNCSLALPEP